MATEQEIYDTYQSYCAAQRKLIAEIAETVLPGEHLACMAAIRAIVDGDEKKIHAVLHRAKQNRDAKNDGPVIASVTETEEAP